MRRIRYYDVTTLLLLHCCVPVLMDCNRPQSKVVRKIIKNELIPLYEDEGANMPLSCPLLIERDMYHPQEVRKYMETISKWVCLFCGKAYYEERHLEAHFHNRHPHTMEKVPDSVCLGQYCDIFRCDIVAGRQHPNSWDVALCQHDDLEKTRNRCQDIIGLCIPQDAEESQQKLLYEKLNHTLCRYLSCELYWELPESVTKPLSAAVYILAGILLIAAVIIYYFVACNSIYDTKEIQFPSIPKEHRTPNAPFPQEIRHRVLSRNNHDNLMETGRS